ncbi:hypothetical protein [Saccharothrix variisporea]|nr:hypothetical protein [Saccharothrix variisporea]
MEEERAKLGQLLSVMPIAQARDMLMGLLEQNPPRPRAVGE